jgi:hypothetical protein
MSELQPERKKSNGRYPTKLRRLVLAQQTQKLVHQLLEEYRCCGLQDSDWRIASCKNMWRMCADLFVDELQE